MTINPTLLHSSTVGANLMEKIENVETHGTKAIPPQAIKIVNDPVAELFKNPSRHLVLHQVFSKLSGPMN